MSAALVKELRERTGLGLLECKKALSEADGDIDAAIEALRKSSGMKAAKKAGRTAADGVVAIQTADDGSFAAMVEVNSETDFVARDENFLGFVQSVVLILQTCLPARFILCLTPQLAPFRLDFLTVQLPKWKFRMVRLLTLNQSRETQTLLSHATNNLKAIQQPASSGN